MTERPTWVQRFDAQEAKINAARNFVVTAFGGPKKGKTRFALESQRPLYLVYMDTNPTLDQMLLRSNVEWGDEVYFITFPPMNYEDLTQAEATSRVNKVAEFAEWAKANARERVAQGKNGGTFVLDGATYYKGYQEKAILGESATLGYRAKKGEHGGPSTFDYAKSNAAVFDFIAGFARQPLDAVFLFEGRPVYQKGLDASGRETSTRTSQWRSTRPERVPFAVNAEVELLTTLERIDPSNNKSPLKTSHQMRVTFNSENPALDQMVMPAVGFQQFKEILLAPTVGDLVLRSESQITRADDSGLEDG